MHKAPVGAIGALGWTEGCSVCRAAPRTLGKELEEELASLCVDWPLEGDGEPRAWNVGLHRDPSKAPDPCGSLQFTEWSCHRWRAGCDADGAVGWGKDKSSWSDVRGRLKGTFLGSFHGHPV